MISSQVCLPVSSTGIVVSAAVLHKPERLGRFQSFDPRLAKVQSRESQIQSRENRIQSDPEKPIQSNEIRLTTSRNLPTYRTHPAGIVVESTDVSRGGCCEKHRWSKASSAPIRIGTSKVRDFCPSTQCSLWQARSLLYSKFVAFEVYDKFKVCDSRNLWTSKCYLLRLSLFSLEEASLDLRIDFIHLLIWLRQISHFWPRRSEIN